MHDYLPDRPSLYQPVGDSQVFTGDPVPFGYQGDKTVYYGHHPVPVTSDGPTTPGSVFCFLRGPHYHGYPSPAQQGYRVEKDVVFYVGPIPPEAARLRPQLEQEQEAEYRPYVAQRPHVVVTPPAEWPGTVWVAPAAAPLPVVVAQPAPPTQVVVVPAAPAQTVVVAPVSPPPTVVVAPVARPAVIVGVPVPGVVVVPGGHPGKGWKHGHFKGKGKGKGHWKHW